jgi:hypothetical protein
MTWEYLSDKVPEFDYVKPVWLDYTTCGLSDTDPPKGQDKFVLESPKWTTTFDGTIMGMGTHVHDGGLRVQVFQNDKQICQSDSIYGGNPEYISPPIMMDNKALAEAMSVDNTHISQQSICYNSGMMKKGDTFHLKGTYDFSQHPPMLNNNAEPSDVMAISIMFIGIPRPGQKPQY